MHVCTARVNVMHVVWRDVVSCAYVCVCMFIVAYGL